jgi:hypothetical protein
MRVIQLKIPSTTTPCFQFFDEILQFTHFKCLKKLKSNPNKVTNHRCKIPIIRKEIKMRIFPIMIDTPMQIIYDITNVSLISENKKKHEGELQQKGKGGSQV